MSDQINDLKAEIAKLRDIVSKLLQERKPLSVFEQSEQINELATALAKAQATLNDPEHDGTVDYTDQKGKRVHYTYAKLPGVLKEIRPKLAAHGLSFSQMPFVNPVTKKIEVMTQIMHSSGQWIRASLGLDHGQGRPQDAAGIITYERRYSISPMVGISAEADTDCNAGPEEEKKSNNAGSNDKKSDSKPKQTKPPRDPNVYAATKEQNIQLKKIFDQKAPTLTSEQRKKIAGDLLGKHMEIVYDLIQEALIVNEDQTPPPDFELPEDWQ